MLLNDGSGNFTDVRGTASDPFAGLVNSYTNNSGSTFTINAPALIDRDAFVADFDGDGDLDLVNRGWNFNAGSKYFGQGGEPPRLLASTPIDGAGNVATTSDVTLTFSETVTPGAGMIELRRSDSNLLVESFAATDSRVSGSGTSFTLDFATTLEDTTAYHLTFGAGAFVDADGMTFGVLDGVVRRGITDPTFLNFTTGSSNAAPVVTTTAGTASFTEGSSIAIDPSLTLADADDTTLSSGRVAITTGFVSGQDVLSFSNTDAGQFGNISASYNAGTGELSLISAGATATLAQWQAALRAVTYTNSSEAPTTAGRTITFTVDDGRSESVATGRALSVTGLNDSPVLDASASPSLAAITEDVIAAANSGTRVSDIVVDGSITDPDGAAIESIAVTALDDTNGTWQFSLDGGTSWTAFGTPTDDAARALDATARIRFVPDTDFAGSATFTFRAWDGTGSAATGGVVDTTPNGDATPFSTATDTASISVTSANDAPTLTTGTVTVTGPNEDNVLGGTLVSAFLTDRSYADVDTGDQQGIAVTATSGNGTWQYSTDGNT
ncbi:Ig-like domain-containing protein [Salinarimonas ramus]